MKFKIIINAVAIALLGLAAAQARAELYFNETQVASLIFPKLALRALELDLSPEEVQLIQKVSGERVRVTHLKVLAGPKREALFIDKVVGKHDFITYALGINSEGRIQGLEIMEYLETYGKQVRGEKWRELFVGKGKDAPLKVGKDIDALSGATISANHISAGVRRLLQTYEVIKKRLP